MKKYALIIFASVAAGVLISKSLEPTGLVSPAKAQQLSPLPAQYESPVDLQNRPAVRDYAGDQLTPEERANIRVYENTNRGVVNIETRIASRERSPFFMMRQVPATGSGSGSILDKDGHILTNFHVIEGASSAQVTLFDGSTYDAELIGADPPNDIAILKIDAPQASLFPIPIGTSEQLRVGQKVYAIGNPFGLERTLTVGILSSLNRTLPSKTLRTMKSILQIDAALNRGNSGGPLMDSQARMIGMNTAIASPSGTGENTGIGFAIPANTLRRVIPELIRNGRFTRADAGIAQVLETRSGVVVTQLVPNGPAEKAGIRGYQLVREQTRKGNGIYVRTFVDKSEADLIVAIDGEPLNSGQKFLELVEKHRPGEQAVFTVIRDGREVAVPVTLGEDT